ncbi:MAG: NAD(P)H-dependent oxidoreductase subunit E [candidate division KSB1 bacterium]|nr:NAD(P)H-dependent oxidoreductase subunit E [candidate division KSB1 bacterium]
MEPFKILVIDDERGIREGCRRILESENYQVLLAENGTQGLELAQSDKVDVALIDLKMPGIDGLEVLREIRKINAEIIPIIVSGHGTIESAVEAMKAGAFDFITKPFEPNQLLKAISRGLEQKKERLKGLELKKEHREQAIDDLNSLAIADEIMARYQYRDAALIAILQDIQKRFNYLPQNLLRYVALRMNVPLTRVYSISTFYKAFSLKPRGKHLINVCLGTACHVRGGLKILERLERELGIKNEETTYDEKFSLKSVRCVGCCGLAPVIVIDNEFHGNLTQEMIPKILSRY